MTAPGTCGPCAGTTSRRLVEPGLGPDGPGRFRAVVEPALGEHSVRKLTGCLQNLTVDRLQGQVVLVETLRR
ncbi:hypothetical protein BH18ACT4_BH18ACT4_11010 [soil metagenome]